VKPLNKFAGYRVASMLEQSGGTDQIHEKDGDGSVIRPLAALAGLENVATTLVLVLGTRQNPTPRKIKDAFGDVSIMTR